MFKKIISCVLVIAIAVSMTATFAFAADDLTVPDSGSTTPSGVFGRVLSSAYDIIAWTMSEANKHADYFYDAIMDEFRDDYCVDAPNNRHNFIQQLSQDGNEYGLYYMCSYCGDRAHSLFSTVEDEYIATLPDGISVSNSGVTAYGTGYTYTTDSTYEELGDLLWHKFDIYTAAANAELGQYMPITASGMQKLAGLKKVTNTNTGLDALMMYSISEKSDYMKPYSPGTIPFQEFVSFSSFYTETTSTFTTTGYSNTFSNWPLFVYLNYSDAYAAYEQLEITSGYIHYLLPETYIDPNFVSSSTSYYMPIAFCNLGRISIENGVIEVLDCEVMMENQTGTSSYYRSFPLVPTKILLDIADYPATTRTGSLMQTINNYNVDNSVVDNSSNVNYYIAPKSYISELGDNPIDLDNCVSPSMYDEETLVFTVPGLGGQILTTGWTYNYTTRTYDISVAPGTTTDGYGVDITQIELVYGDDIVSVTGYTADGTAVMSEEYAYVMVSGDETFGTGGSSGDDNTGDDNTGDDTTGDADEETHKHSYTDTVTTEPTCEAPGIRKYTCDECGDSYTEKISATGHTWTVKQSVATEYDETGAVTVQGYTIYKCSVCNTEYKDEAGTGPPNNSADSTDDTEGLLKKIGNLIGSILSGIIDMISSVLGGILDALTNLADMLGEKLTGIVDTVMALFERIPQMFGGFLDLLSAVFPFIPQEIIDVLTFGLIALVFVGLFKYIIKR